MTRPKNNKYSKQQLFSTDLVVLNVGLDVFYDALTAQKVEAVQVVWQAPPVLEKELAEALDKVT